MTLADKINEEIKNAMKSRNQVRLDTLRMLKSKILAVDARGNVPDSEVQKLFKTYYGNLQEALTQSLEAGRKDAASRLQEEIAIVQEYLPSTPTREETRQIVIQTIAEMGAKNKKESGLVMKAIMKSNSSIDGKLAKELADELLSEE